MRKIFLSVMAMLLMFASAAVAEPTRTFNVAVGTLPSAGNEIPDPNIFINLNSHALKPAGWDIISSQVNIATISTPDLLNYDLIFLTNHTTTAFTNTDRAKVQEWINAGGTLWLDDCGDMVISNFFVNFNFASYDYYKSHPYNQPVDGAKWTSNPTHYFFNNAYTLTPEEISHLGSNGYSSHVTDYNPSEWTILLNNRGPSGDYPDVMVKNYGLGRIIVTADDYGCMLNDVYPIEPEDAKFAYNVLKWAQENPEPPKVPEPSTLLLLLSGLGVVAGSYRVRGK